jgi:hypothetical protein
LFASVAKEALKASEKRLFALVYAKVVSNIFGKATKVFLQVICFMLRQEGFEEMTEELFQDVCKQVASAYGALINNAKRLEKEDTLQYLMMVILKMLQSVTLPLGSWSYRWTYG